jgi:hypothetical protein
MRSEENVMVGRETDKASHEPPFQVDYSNSRVFPDPDKYVSAIRASGKSQLSHRLLLKYRRLRMFLSECRNWVSRIYTVLTNNDAYRVPTGSAYLEARSGRIFRNTRTLACIRDIERISSNRPSTPLDWAAYRDAWEAGVEWASSISDSDTLDSEHKTLLISRRLGTSASRSL